MQGAIREDESFETLMSRWDRAGFGVAMRRIEILIIRGRDREARAVFDELVRSRSRARYTMSAELIDVLPERIVNQLQMAGLNTLHAVAMATDSQLLEVKEIGPTVVQLIRDTITAIRDRKPLPSAAMLADLEPEWELDLSESACTCRPNNGVCAVTTPTTVIEPQHQAQRPVDDLAKAIDLIANSGEEAIAAIDREIGQINERLDVLKRMRKMIASGDLRSKAKKLNYSQDLIKRMRQALQEHGELRAKELADIVADGNYTLVGRVAKASGEFESRSGLIRLAS